MSSTTETSQPQVGNGDGASATDMVQMLGVNLRVCWGQVLPLLGCRAAPVLHPVVGAG
jgi:hypothetical protein